LTYCIFTTGYRTKYLVIIPIFIIKNILNYIFLIIIFVATSIILKAKSYILIDFSGEIKWKPKGKNTGWIDLHTTMGCWPMEDHDTLQIETGSQLVLTQNRPFTTKVFCHNQGKWTVKQIWSSKQSLHTWVQKIELLVQHFKEELRKHVKEVKKDSRPYMQISGGPSRGNLNLKIDESKLDVGGQKVFDQSFNRNGHKDERVPDFIS
jgi:hypothetical protein